MELGVLQEIGFTSREAKIYIATLELGSASVQEIAGRAEIDRTYAYKVLASLKKKGLVSHTIESGSKHFEAAEPEKLLQLVAERQKKIEQLLPALEGIRKSVIKKPSIEIYEKKEGIKTLIQHVLKNATSGYVGIGNHKNFEKYFAAYTQDFIVGRAKQDIPAAYLFEDSKKARELIVEDEQRYRKTKNAPELNDVKAEMWTYGDTLILFTTVKEQPIGLKIQNKEISQLFQKTFEIAWKHTPSPTPPK